MAGTGTGPKTSSTSTSGIKPSGTEGRSVDEEQRGIPNAQTSTVIPTAKVPTETSTGGSTGRPLPAACQKKKGATLETMRAEAAKILSLSNSFSQIYQKEVQRIKQLKDPFKTLEVEELGTFGRSGNLVVIQLSERLTDMTIFDVVSTIAHEYGHATEVLRDKFTFSEAAEFLNISQYLTLRWQSELNAFMFQEKILREIVQADNQFQRCLELIQANDKILLILIYNQSVMLEEAKRIIVERYEPRTLMRKYLSERQESKKIESANIQKIVEQFLRSGMWKQYEKAWERWAGIFR